MKKQNPIQFDIDQTSTFSAGLTTYTTQLNVAGTSLQVSFDKKHFTRSAAPSLNNIENDINVQQDAKLPHFHLYFEVFCVFDESVLIVTENKTYKLKNSIIIVPPYLNHYALSHENAKVFRLNLQSEKTNNTLSLPPHLLMANTIFIFPMDEETEIYIKLLQNFLNNNTSNSRSKIPLLINMIVLHFFDLLSLRVQNDNTNPSSAFLKYVTQIELILARIYTEDIKLSTIADELFLSKMQVSRIIKKAYNCTLAELIINKKLSVACNFLKNTNKSIAEIIKDLNFKTESYFFVLFKQYYNCTPLAYRKQLQRPLKDNLR